VKDRKGTTERSGRALFLGRTEANADPDRAWSILRLYKLIPELK